MRRLRVLLDANILVDAKVRDFFLTSAELGAIDVRWSAEIVEEMSRALVEKMGHPKKKILHLAKVLGEAFPDAAVDGYEPLISGLVMPDPDDRHVLAAAIHSDCDLLVTENLGDFPVSGPGDMLICSVDDAICYLVGLHPAVSANAVHRQLARLKRPPETLDDFIAQMMRRAPIGGLALGAAVGLPEFDRLLRDAMDSESSDGPQEAVRLLLEAVASSSVDALASLIAPEYMKQLLQLGQIEDIFDEFVSVLSDVSDSGGWGFATAKRLIAPNVEVVKLIRAGDEAIVASKPTLVHGHQFKMALHGGRWLLEELNGPDAATVGEVGKS